MTKSVEWPENNKDEVVTEIFALARRLLEKEDTASIIKSAGTKRGFTDEEQLAIDALALEMLSDQIAEGTKRVTPDQGSQKLRTWNTHVATGLARRVSEGEFSDFDDPEAVSLIYRNANYLNMRPEDSFSQRKVSFEFFYRVLCEYMQLPNLKELFEKWHQGWAGADSDNEDEQHAQAYGFVWAPAWHISCRYGEVCLASWPHVAHAITRLGIDYRNSEAVKKLMHTEFDKYARAHLKVIGFGNG